MKLGHNYSQWLSYLSGAELAPPDIVFMCLGVYPDPLQLLQQGRPLSPPHVLHQPSIHRSSIGEGLESESISQNCFCTSVLTQAYGQSHVTGKACSQGSGNIMKEECPDFVSHLFLFFGVADI